MLKSSHCKVALFMDESAVLCTNCEGTWCHGRSGLLDCVNFIVYLLQSTTGV